MRLVQAVGVVLALWTAAGCADAATPTGATAHRPVSAVSDVPDVRGESAPTAVRDLRAAGFATFTVAGQWSADPLGTVVSQEPAPGSTDGTGAAALTVSLGAERDLLQGVDVDLGTCDLGPRPDPAAPCAGGPVLLRPPAR